MRFELDNFSGGENTWFEPYLLKGNQAVSLVDADVSSGAIKPFPGKEVANTLPDGVADLTASRSVVKWGREYFWSDDVTEELNSTLGYVGITPPSEPPTVRFGEYGDRFTGEYRYLCRFTTDDGYASAPYAQSATYKYAHVNCTHESITIPTTYYDLFQQDHIYPLNYNHNGYLVGDRVTWAGKDYECIKAIWRGRPLDYWGLYYYPGTNTEWWKDITLSPIVSTGYDEMTVTVPRSYQSQVTAIELYRTVSDGDDFYLAATLDSGSRTIADRMSDSELIFQTMYESTGIAEPLYVAEGGAARQVGGKFLTELDGTFYLTYDDKVYLSEPGNPHAWNPLKFVRVDDNITAIAKAVASNGVGFMLVFTKNRTYRLSGTTLADVSITDLQSGQGCPNSRSIAYLKNMPVWMSYDGLCSYSNVPNREGQYVTVLTEQRYKFESQPTHAVAANDVYYAFYDSKAVCFDFRQDLLAYERTLTADLAYYDEDNDRLLVKQGSVWYDAGAGEDQEWTYLSPELTAGKQTLQKRWKQYWVDCTGAVELTAYLDGEQLFTKDLSAGRKRRKFPRTARGQRLQFKLTGTGTLRSIQIEVA